MDERMLRTGTVPVSDQLGRLPAAANGERKSFFPRHTNTYTVAILTNGCHVVPSKAKQAEEEDEEAELEKLRAEMAMG